MGNSHREGALRAIAGPDMVVLRSTEEHRGENLQTFSEFTIKKGETATFVITYGPSYEDPPETIDAEQALRETVSYWQGWTARANLIGEYDDAIERSLVTLKALTYQHTGGIVGARPHRCRSGSGANEIGITGTAGFVTQPQASSL